jgi:hypothetical protein
MARFVKCNDDEVLGDIVRYNNTQNKVEATDFRSKSPIQDRLRNQFATVPDAEYRGGRRGGSSDVIERKKSLLPDSSVAQSLAAFHGDPNLAYNETRTIWDKDDVYVKVFRDSVSARHIVFTYSLLKAIEQIKQSLVDTPEDKRTEAQKKHLIFLKTRGSNYLFAAAVGACIETILSRAVPDRYGLRFRENISPSAAVALWEPVVRVVLSFSNTLQPATDQGLKRQERVEQAIEAFGSMVEAARSANEAPFNRFASMVDG